MSDQRLNLVQRWMQAVITHPGGVEGSVADAANVASGNPDDFIARSHSQSSSQRLSIYANAYFARLI